MSAPVYFLSGINAEALFPGERVNRETLRTLGIADLWRDTLAERAVDWFASERIDAKTPSSRPGMFVTALPIESRRTPRVVSDWSDGTWEWVEGAAGVWLGVDALSPVTPEDVERRKQYKGHWVELADGREWLIPVIRRPVYGPKVIRGDDGSERHVEGWLEGIPRLSQTMAMDPATRRVVRSIRPCDQRIWDWSARFYPLVYRDPGDKPEIPGDEDLFEFAATLLAMNYRLGIAELNAWKLIEESHLVPILQAAMDMPFLVAGDEATTQKKT